MQRPEDQQPSGRDVTTIAPPHLGAVADTPSEVPPYRLTGLNSAFEAAANGWLRALFARDLAVPTIRSYAYDLLRWGRFLLAPQVDLDWDRVTEDDYADFVLWARQAAKRRTANGGKRTERPAANLLTGKPYPDVTLAATTINHSDTVLHEFYEYQMHRTEGPLLNPVAGMSAGRKHAHHNPMDPFVHGRRKGYRQKAPERLPRALSDSAYAALFDALPHDRDRALMEAYVSTGARASELLLIEGHEVDYGEQQFLVSRKGSRAQQWLQASSDAFMWLARYQAEVGAARPGEPVWRTVRGPVRPLGYHAWLRVFERANARLGTNWTPHDLRHTCALRMLDDENLDLRDVQHLLGHAHITTTQGYLRVRPDEVIRKVREHQSRLKEVRGVEPPTANMRYSSDDLKAVFGDNA